MNFKDSLTQNILEYIRNVKKEGTVKMSIDNLMQCVKTPSTSLTGAPCGTNARYYYAQLFREVVNGDKKIKAFII